MNVSIPAGALFYGQTRRREAVAFDKRLRTETEEIAQKVHELIDARITPKPEYAKKCEKCSLMGLCMPKTCGKTKSVTAYMQRAVEKE